MPRRSLYACLALTVAGLAWQPGAQAVPINGTIGLNTTSVVLSPSNNLNTATSVQFLNAFVSPATNKALATSVTGDYTPIIGAPAPPITAANTFTFSGPLVLSSLVGFTATNGNGLTFTSVATSGGFTSQVLDQGNNVLDVFLVGFVTGAGGSFDASNLSSVLFSLNQSGGAGGSVSGAITLSSPPSGTQALPEPSSVLALTSAFPFLALGGLRAWRRRKSS